MSPLPQDPANFFISKKQEPVDSIDDPDATKSDAETDENSDTESTDTDETSTDGSDGAGETAETNTTPKKPSIVRRAFNSLAVIFTGKTTISPPTDVPLEDEIVQRTPYVPAFSAHEIKLMRHARHADMSMSNIHGSLKQTARRIAERTSNSQTALSLSPEIGQASKFLISTILSPNDIKHRSLSFTYDTTGLSQSAISDIDMLFNNYFVEELKLDLKLAKWLDIALFKTGASPVLVLPRHVLRDMASISEIQATTTNNQHLDAISVSTEGLFDTIDVTALSSSVEDLTIPTELQNFNRRKLNGLPLEYIDIMLESYSNVDTSALAGSEIMNADMFMSKVVSHTEGVFKKAKITVSTDISKLRTDSKQTAINKIYSKLTNKIIGSSDGGILNVSDTVTDNADDIPLLISLSSESTIPVFIPGEPEEHIGYYIWTENGTPVDMASRNITMQHARNFNCGVTAAYNGVAEAASARVFDLTLSNMLKAETKEKFNIASVEVATHQGLSKCIYHRLQRRLSVNLIFVPASLVAYYAFDYHADGTGKSLLYDLRDLIGLRNNLLLSDIHAAIANGTADQIVSFDVDKKSKNVKALMSEIKNILVKKKTLNIDGSVRSTLQDIASKHVVFNMSALKGLENFGLEYSEEGKSKPVSDSDLRDTLSSRIKAGLIVPASVFDTLSEEELATSVVTKHLFFSNEIQTLQRTTVECTTKICRTLAMHNKPLCKRMMKIINGSLNIVNDKEPTKNATLVFTNILGSLRATLPTPNVVATKAQLTELTELVSNIEELIKALFPDELLLTEDNERDRIYGAKRAYIHAQILRKALPQLGLSQLLDIPKIDEVDLDGIMDLLKNIANNTKQVNDYRTSILSEQ